MTGGIDGQIYQYTHMTPVPGVNCFRLALMFTDGNHYYSETIKVDVSAPPVYNWPYTGRSPAHDQEDDLKNP